MVQSTQFSPALLRAGQVECVQIWLAVLSYTVCCDGRRLPEGLPLSWGECAGRALHKDITLSNRDWSTRQAPGNRHQLSIALLAAVAALIARCMPCRPQPAHLNRCVQQAQPSSSCTLCCNCTALHACVKQQCVCEHAHCLGLKVKQT